MKFFLRVLCLFLCGLCVSAFSLDRNAFTFTRYDLDVSVSPAKSQLKVDGTITLRNDSSAPQRFVDLQISSSLDWTSVEFKGKPVQYFTQPYRTDTDHTGEASEAIVSLPVPIPPRESIELRIAYEGTISEDATRLIRNGVPEDQAKSTDWDRIGETFTAVRGFGYVLWYPVATDSADFSEPDVYFDILGAFREREADASMSARFWSDSRLTVVADGERNPFASTSDGELPHPDADYRWEHFGLGAPTFAIAAYKQSDDPASTIFSLPDHETLVRQYQVLASTLAARMPYIGGAAHLTIIDLPNPSMAPYESGSILFAPVQRLDPNQIELLIARPLFRSAFFSPRPWIEEGLARFEQAVIREQESNRQAALDYMKLQLPAILEAEKPVAEALRAKAPGRVGESLLSTTDEAFYGSKAMYVWWMLRDLVGEEAFSKALAVYKPDLDNRPTYVQSLFEQASGKKLEWFFDDWVYRDRGLPDFHPGEIYARPTLNGTYVVTVVVSNGGAAGAQVPVIARGEGGSLSQPVIVPAHDQGTVRIPMPGKPIDITINDGSVPEWDLENNSGKTQTPVKTPPPQ